MNFSEMDVVILCGGRGERLGALTKDIPKPMVKIGEKPFLEILIEKIAGQGFRKFILCTGYQGKVIQDYFSNRRPADPQIRFSHEEKPLATGGALKLCEPLIQGEEFLVLNGDSFCEVDLKAMLDFHKSRPAKITIAVVGHDTSRYDAGTIEIGQQGDILKFKEKSTVPGQHINAGVYFVKKKTLDLIPKRIPVSLEEDFFPAFRDGIYAFVTASRLYDIGTPERLEIFRNDYTQKEKCRA